MRASYQSPSRLTHCPSALTSCSPPATDHKQWDRLEKTSRMVTSSSVYILYEMVDTSPLEHHMWDAHDENFFTRWLWLIFKKLCTWTNYTENLQFRIKHMYWMLNAYLSDRKRGKILVIVWAAASLITWPDRLGERGKKTMIMEWCSKIFKFYDPGRGKNPNGKKI